MRKKDRIELASNDMDIDTVTVFEPPVIIPSRSWIKAATRLPHSVGKGMDLTGL